MSAPGGWIGVDLDGTLARYDGWHGIEYIGPPIARVVSYVKELRRAGVEVRIFTARLQELGALIPIQNWSQKHLGEVLPVTDRKDFGMVYLVDDRAVPVEPNTGRFLLEPPSLSAIHAHWNTPGMSPPVEEFRHE